MITVGSVIPGGFERIKKPFISIPDIYKGLIRHKKFHPCGGPHRSCDVSVVPNHPTKYTEVRHYKVCNAEIVVKERSSGRLPSIGAMMDKTIVNRLTESDLPPRT